MRSITLRVYIVPAKPVNRQAGRGKRAGRPDLSGLNRLAEALRRELLEKLATLDPRKIRRIQPP